MANTSVSSTTVVAYFTNQSAAQNAVSQLQQAGFGPNQIGVAVRGTNGETTAAPTSEDISTGKHAGTTHESAWDKFKNFFSSDPVEPYADERSRGDLASHEITTGSEYGNSGYSNEDFDSSLSGMSVPEERSRYFGHRFNHGEQGAVVTVNAEDREAEAEKILVENGGDLGNDAAGYDYSDGNTGATAAAGQHRIQLLGEVLRVHKDRISRGEVTIRKEVITETQTVEVPVTREELVIERSAPTGARSATGRVGESSEIRIPLSEEVASADKDTVVREEVSVGKRAVQSVSNVGQSVSHEELVVDDATRKAEGNKRTA